MGIYKVLFIDKDEDTPKINYSDTIYFLPPQIYKACIYAKNEKYAYLMFYNRWPRNYKVMSITEPDIDDWMENRYL